MRKLIYLAGYQFSGKSTASKFIKKEFFSKSICFDVGEVVRDWVLKNRGSLSDWMNYSLQKNSDEGFEWIFKHAIAKLPSGKKNGNDIAIVISGNRIFKYKTRNGVLDFLDEAKRFFSAKATYGIYIKASFKTRFARNCSAVSRAGMSRKEFVKKDRLDQKLGLRAILHRTDYVLRNEGSIGLFKKNVKTMIAEILRRNLTCR